MTKQLSISTKQWDKEFVSGKWDYLNLSPIERARHAIIAMYIQSLTPEGLVLDVGCGEGTLIDFLTPLLKKNYFGIDISSEAIKKAKKKRTARFSCIPAKDFTTKKKFNAIVFNEVLYYLDDKLILKQYSKLLNKDGFLVISLYRTNRKRYDRQIIKNSKKLFSVISTIEVSGKTKGQNVIWQISVLRKK